MCLKKTVAKRNRYRVGLEFGIIMAISLIAYDFITMDQWTTKEITKSIVAGLVTGALCGLSFSWINAKFSNSKFIVNSTKIFFDLNEQLILETPANHFKGIEAVGGKLYLTNKRFVFKSHKLNVQRHELSINLSDIIIAEKHKTFGLINNGLIVQTINGAKEKFVLEDANKWIIQLDIAKNDIHQEIFTQK